MIREGFIFVLAAVLTLPGMASAQAADGSDLHGPPSRGDVTQAASHASAAGAGTLSGSSDAHTVVLAAHGGVLGARGGMRAAPRFGSALRFGHPAFRPVPFRRFPFRPFPFRPFVSFGFVAPLYVPYYPYNPYCDSASVYYYPPWCSY